MRQFWISELDPRALELARRWNLGIETIAFCTAENMEDAAMIARKAAELEPFPEKSLHAPYYELTPCAIDSLIHKVSLHRYKQAVQLCADMGVRRLVVHSGYQPQTYYPEWFVPKSIAFWRSFMQNLEDDLEIVLENVLDPSPEYLVAIVDAVNDARLKICLDVGHALAYSDIPVSEWISTMGSRIAHVHLHNNSGKTDAHAALDCGVLDVEDVLRRLDVAAPEAAIVIESVDGEACVRYLLERGYLK